MLDLADMYYLIPSKKVANQPSLNSSFGRQVLVKQQTAVAESDIFS